MSKTALVTGSTSGIGFETVIALLTAGFTVYAGSRNPEHATHLLQKAQELNFSDKLIPLKLDVNSDELVNSALEIVQKNYGGLDVLCNNAGFAFVGALQDFSTQEMKEQYETNVFGVHRVVKAFLPLIRNQKGVIINISSMGGKITFPFFALYNSTKFAVESYTEGLRYELQPEGISVYLVEPGMIQTSFYSKNMKFPHSFQHSVSIYKYLYERYTKEPDKSEIGTRSHPSVVAAKIIEIVHNRPTRFRHPVGKIAREALFIRWLLPDRIFHYLLSKIR